MISIGQTIEPNNLQCQNRSFKIIKFLGKGGEGEVLCTPNVGSPLFQAPEIVNNQQYSTPIDIWSLGCVFFEVLTKQPLCLAKSEEEQVNCLKEHLNNPNNFYRRVDQYIGNQSLQKLIKEMIHLEPLK